MYLMLAEGAIHRSTRQGTQRTLDTAGEAICRGERTQNFMVDHDPRMALAISLIPRALLHCDLDTPHQEVKNTSPPLESEPAYGPI